MSQTLFTKDNLPINALEFDITYTRIEAGSVIPGGGSISD